MIASTPSPPPHGNCGSSTSTSGTRSRSRATHSKPLRCRDHVEPLLHKRLSIHGLKRLIGIGHQDSNRF